MARDLILNAVTKGDTAGLVKTAAAVDHLANKVDEAGDEMRETTVEAKALDAQISRTQGTVRRLAVEMAHAGDESGDLGRRFREARRELALLHQARRALTPDRDGRSLVGTVAGAGVTAGAQAAGSAANAASGAASSAVSSPTTFIVAAAATAAVGALLPAIGASVSAAVLGTIGGGGILGGVMLAAGDARVRAAFGALGENMFSDLQHAAGAFVGPLLEGAEKFQAAWDKALSGDLAGIFADLSREVGPLIDGVIGFAEEAMPGLKEAVKASLPVLHVLARELPNVGHALGTMLSMMSKGQGSAMAMSLGMKGLAFVLVETGRSLALLSGMFEQTVRSMANLIHLAASMPGAAGWIKDLDKDTQSWLAHIGDTGASFNNLGFEMDATAEKATELSNSFDQLFGRTMAAWEANLGFEGALDKVSESFRENGAAMDASTAAGRANQESLKDGIGWANRMREAEIAASDGSEAAVAVANQRYREHVQQLIAAAVAAGADRVAVEKLTAALWAIPPERRSNVIVTYIQRGNSYLAGVNAAGVQQVRGDRWGNVYERAEVGLLRDAQVYPSRSPGRFMIAEPATGGEAFVPKRGNYGRSMSILSQAAGWYGADVVPRGASMVLPASGGAGSTRNYAITVNVAPGASPADVGSELVAAIKAYERDNGNGWRG